MDAEAIEALNPHHPAEPVEVEEPEKPEEHFMRRRWDEKEKEEHRREYRERKAERANYLKAHAAWLASPELKEAPKKLTATLRDLRRRGLVQVGEGTQAHYDLHPVVRGIVSGALRGDETARLGQRVVDHFSQRAHSPYEQAESLLDLTGGFHIVRTLLRMGRFEQALQTWRGNLSNAAFINVAAYPEMLALLKPLFPQGWLQPPTGLSDLGSSYVMNDVALALKNTGLLDQAIQLYVAKLRLDAAGKRAIELRIGLSNLSFALRSANRLANTSACTSLAQRAAEATKDNGELFRGRFDVFVDASIRGDWKLAEALWDRLDAMGRNWHRAVYAPGSAERWRAANLWWQGRSPQEALDAAEPLARGAKARRAIRNILNLRGEWRLAAGDATAALAAFDESAQLARASGQADLGTETWLALARQQAGQLTNSRVEATRLQDAGASGWPLAKLWQAAGEPARARQQALAACRWAWADGEPYVHRFEFDRARALLNELGEPIPKLPPYDPTRHPRFDWQDEVEAALTAIEAKQAEQAAAKEKKPRRKPS